MYTSYQNFQKKNNAVSLDFFRTVISAWNLDWNSKLKLYCGHLCLNSDQFFNVQSHYQQSTKTAQCNCQW